jgi:hypothetical protein
MPQVFSLTRMDFPRSVDDISRLSMVMLQGAVSGEAYPEFMMRVVNG